MVGRLVEQQQVGRLEEHAAQRDARLREGVAGVCDGHVADMSRTCREQAAAERGGGGGGGAAAGGGRLLAAREEGELVFDLLALEHELAEQRAQLLVPACRGRAGPMSGPCRGSVAGWLSGGRACARVVRRCGGVLYRLQNRLVEGEGVGLVLLEVARHRVGRDHLGAASPRGLRPEDEPQQRRLARPVRADDRDPVAALDAQVDVREEGRAAVAVLDALELDELLGAARRGREAEAEPRACGEGLGHVLIAAGLQLGERALLGAHRRGGGLVVAQARDVRLERLDLLLLRLPRRGGEPDPLALELQEGAVVACGVGLGLGLGLSLGEGAVVASGACRAALCRAAVCRAAAVGAVGRREERGLREEGRSGRLGTSA